MNIYDARQLSDEQRRRLTTRPSQSASFTNDAVQSLCIDVKQRGDAALREYTQCFDKVVVNEFRVSDQEIASACATIPASFQHALQIAVENIRAFHRSQIPIAQQMETMPGVLCRREPRAIERVGLYVPAGSAPLPSTVLMLGIPATLAGCPHIVLCSPPKADGKIDPYVLVAADALGICEVYKVGGAQAIAAMAYGTQSIPKVDKIFGPGNRYVAAAKQFISNDSDGAAIDMLAGPSEVLVIADEAADPAVVAYDLISQAEHDPDAQAVLVTTSSVLAKTVSSQLLKRAEEFSRREIILKSLKNSFALIVESVEAAVKFSNEYAPEHLVLNTEGAERIIPLIVNAGSVFVGRFAPVTAGDYASGTNHTLPTSGTARWFSGVSVESFMKMVTFQILTQQGLQQLEPTLTTFANAEGLAAHACAVTSRLKKL
jgi:histidinol dehydrogenase